MKDETENQNPGDFFVTGGTLAPDAPSYVVRPADGELYEGLRRGEFCYVLNTRQMGKSSLMVRTAKRLKEEGATIAVIDLTAIGRNVTPAQWYNGMLTQIAAQIDDDGATDDALTAFWRDSPALSPLQRFFGAIESVFLQALTPLIIFIDEVDATRSLPFPADEFFAGIRECYNRRATDSRWNRLAFCLLGVATPSDLIADARMSPFNIGRRIRLTDFTEKECLFSFALRAKEKMTDSIIRRVLYWTGGHPYLTQRLLRAFAERGEETPREAEAAVDFLCERLFLNRDSRENDDNLTFVRNRLLRGGEDLPALLDLYGKIRAGKRIRDDETDSLRVALRLAGVVKPDAKGFLVVRNRIYDRVFDREWIETHLPDREARRQKAAFWRGVRRSAAFGAAGVAAFGALAAVAVGQAREARRLERLAQERLSVANAENGLRLLEEGDPQAALVPLTEALKVDEKYLPERVEMARLRLAAAREMSPRLVYAISCGGPILCAALDKTRHRFAVGTETGTARLYDVPTGKQLTPEMRHEGAVRYVAFSPDQTMLATACSDGTAHLWDTTTGRPLCPPLRYHDRNAAVRVDWSPDSKTVAISGVNGSALFDAPTGANRRTIWDTDVPPWRVTDPPVMETRAVAFSPDGKRLAFIAGNYLANFADSKTGKMNGTLASCYRGSQIAFSPDGRRATIAGTFDRSRRTKGGTGGMLYDGATGKEIALLPHGDAGTDACFSPNGALLATAAQDGTARVWEGTKGAPLTPYLRQNGGITTLRFSPDGRRLITASQAGTAQVWNAMTGRPLLPPLRHSAPLRFAEFISDAGNAEEFLTAGMDGYARLWRPAGETARDADTARIPEWPGVVTEARLGIGGRYIALQYRPAHSLPGAAPRHETWDALTGTRLFPPAGTLSPAGTVIARNAEESRLILLDGVNLRVWDVPTARTLFTTVLPTTTRTKAALTDDGELLEVFWKEGTGVASRSFDLRTGATLPPVDGSRPNFLSAASRSRIVLPFQSDDIHNWISRQGRFTLFFALNIQPESLRPQYEGRLTLWDIVTNKQITLPGSLRDLNAAVFSPEERYLLVSSRDTRLYALRSGDSIPLPFKSGTRPVLAAFSRDETRLVTGSDEGVAQVWDATTGTPVLPPLVHPGTIVAAAFRPDGLCFATAASDGSVFVWDARTGERVLPVLHPPGGVKQLSFIPDNRALLTAGEGGVYRYPLSPASD